MSKKERNDAAAGAIPSVPVDRIDMGVVQAAHVNLTREEKIDRLRKARDMHTGDYDETTMAVLIEAAQSDDKELYAEAVGTVHMSLRPYENYFLITRFGIYSSAKDYDDFIQVLGEVVTKELCHWDPARGKLSTFFQPRFKKACLIYKNRDNSTMSSMHYEAVYLDIKRAQASLEQQGIKEPSILQLRNEMALHNHEHSVQTIEKCLGMVKDVSSLDACGELADRTSANPLEAVLQSELSEQVDEIINSMEAQYQIVIRTLRNFIAEGDCDEKVTNETLKQCMEDYIGPVSEEWVRNIRQSAEFDFRRRALRKGIYQPRRTRKKSIDFHELGNRSDDEDILNALEKNEDDVFPPDEY